MERIEEEPAPVKGQVCEGKFSGNGEDTLVLDVMNIQLEVQQAVKQLRPTDKNLDIFCLEVVIVIMTVGCFLRGKYVAGKAKSNFLEVIGMDFKTKLPEFESWLR